jgi:hypothetical protein
MANPNNNAPQRATNAMPDNSQVSRPENLMEANLGDLEASYKLLTDWSLYLLIAAGVIALAVGIVTTLATRKGEALIHAKDAQLKRDLKKADERISKANQATEEARLETERLKKQLAWRRVSAEQQQILVAELKGHPMTVWTAFISNDPESVIFRDDIDKALKTAGIETRYFGGLELVVGLEITHVPGPAYDLLVKAFKKAGLPFTTIPPVNGLDGLAILVGTKPSPF